ncbi:hypothetical protein CEB3_c21130 [Peptococcaceae bacterium CEB3]|nr:hypothetical protein CEB3_c21130 [Peptococcaceae bacterium CEB3]
MYRMPKKYKWVAVLILAVILVLVMSSVVMAATASTSTSPTPLLSNKKVSSYYANSKNKPNYGERFIAGILIGSVKWVMNVCQLSDPVVLVFNVVPKADASNQMLAQGLYSQANKYVLGLFPKPFFDAVSVLYNGFKYLLPYPLVIALILFAIMHMINSGTAQGRAKIKDNAKFILIALATVRFGAYIWSWIILLNDFFVKLIWLFMMSHGVKPTFFMDMIWGAGQKGFDAATQMLGIPMVILLILAAMMVLALNYQYTMRFIILGLLIMIFPLAAGLTIFPGFRHALPMWFKEFVANVILQLAHALALGVFFITIYSKGMQSYSGVSFWLMITYFAGMPTIASLIREMLGLQPGGGSRAVAGISAMAGIASVAAMGRMMTRSPIKGQVGKDAGGASGGDGGALGGIGGAMGSGTALGGLGGAMGAMAGGIGGGKGGSTPLSGATSTLGRMAQGAFNTGSTVARSAGAVAGNKAVRTAAKVGLGASAAVAGGVMSSMISGKATPGAMLGIGGASLAGRHGGKLVGNAAGSVGGHIRTAAETLSAGGGLGAVGRNIGQNVMSKSIEKGGMLAGATFGYQGAMNKISSRPGSDDVPLYDAPGFFQENRETIQTAQNSMRELQPQMDMAQAKYEHSLAHNGADDQKTKDLHDQYQGLKGMYDTHAADATLARMRMRSHDELKAYVGSKKPGTTGNNSSYSANRGVA